MTKNKTLLSPLSILMIVIVLAALATWLIPAGQYDRIAYSSGQSFTYRNAQGEQQLPFAQRTLDSLRINIPLQNFESGGIKKPVSVPGTYKTLPENRQGIVEILKAPIRGVHESIDIVFFILMIGAFMQVFTASGAMTKGIAALSHKMQGREAWLIVILTFLFCFGGASFGMAEEGLVFYPLLVPIFLAAGFDLLVPVAVIFAGTQMGTLSSFSNPFSTIIASNAAGVSWTDGLTGRIAMFIISSCILITYIVRYALRVKKDPTASLVYQLQGNVVAGFANVAAPASTHERLDTRTSLLLLQFFLTFIIMIAGVVFYEWWLLEMTTLFFASTLLLGIILRMKETDFLKEFLEGAASLLSVALIIGTARGVTVVLNEGNISDSIIYYAANFAQQMPSSIFIIAVLIIYMLFTLFISSSSGMAVLTMPIMGSLAMLVNVPGREIVNAYLFGMGIMGFITPTGLMLPALALTKLSVKTWWRFIYPVLIILFVVCATGLIIGVYMA
ncbi:MAG: YfcC family protein [Chitinophagaceae bacterium]|nr:MAG: YfcC family protein [Chitinophagaceae bacterium]